jgi:hypothetical protein
MDADEREIYYFLKFRTRQFAPAREISLRAGAKRRFRSEPEWAKPALLRLVERDVLEADGEGRYRLKPMPKQDTTGKIWASQEILNLLKNSGKASGNLITVPDQDEYYLNL